MKKFQTWCNYTSEHKKEPTTGVSMTVPDMSMSTREILIRFSQGRSVPQNPNLVYGGEEYLPDMRKYDLTEQDEMIKINNANIEAYKADIEAKIKERKDLANARINAKKANDKTNNNEQNGGSEADDNGE